MIRPPDKGLEQSLLVGIRYNEQQCLDAIKELLQDKVPRRLVELGFSFLPQGFVIEGVAYGEAEEEPIDAYDLDIKVLH